MKQLFAVFMFGFAIANLASAEPDSHKNPRFLVHLLDYLAKDYSGAVSPQGAVISDSEYKEQIEFAEIAEGTSFELKELEGHDDLKKRVTALKDLIAAKAHPDAVASTARALQQEIVQLTQMEVAPQHWPSLARGRDVFSQNCVSCHGPTGHGDGPAGSALDPKPADFLDDMRMAGVSPLQAFNTIRLGVPGTGMTAYPALSDEDVWAVAFFVIGLRQSVPEAPTPASKRQWDADDLKLVSTSSDEALRASFAPAEIAALRLHSEDAVQKSTLATALQLLDEALIAYRRGENADAKSKAIRAYLEGIEPVEPRLRSADAVFASELEERMGDVRSAIDQVQPLATVEAAFAAAKEQIEAARSLIEHKDIAPGVAFAAASAILLREGFEAVLLILALLGVIRASGSRTAARWVHAGWIAALLAGGLCWVFSGYLIDISGAQREMMEAFTSLFAVLVLLVVGFWLHSRTEIGRWNHFLKIKVRAALDQKKLFGLASISFIAVFREAFETVLFLRAVWLEGGAEAKSALAAGVFSTLALIIIGAWAVLRYSARIPVRKLFALSAYVMAILAFILTGKGLHSLQETGALGVTSLRLPLHWDLVGLYPTWETLATQAAVLAVIAVLWVAGRRPSPALRRAQVGR